MNTELEALAKKFESHRNKYPGRKVHYPPRLAKAASGLDYALGVKVIARSLGISDSSVLAWRKKYKKPDESPTFIPVAIEPQSSEGSGTTCVRIMIVEANLPTANLAATIKGLAASLGGASC